MRRKIFCLFTCLIISTAICLAAADAETILKLNGISETTSSNFFLMHPDVKRDDLEYHYYASTNEMITDFLLGSFDYDAFSIMSSSINHQALMSKGYFLDLSSSTIISNAINDLYPAYAEQCVYDGKIYAIPVHTQINYWAFYTPVLEQTDFDKVHVPSTFPEFLDFLDQWIEYLKGNPEGDVALIGMAGWGDASFYNEQSYTNFLVEQLLDNYIMQKEYAGEELNFEDSELVELLKRCARIGAELYDYDPAVNCSKAILRKVVYAGVGSEYQFMSLRLNDTQPKLMTIYLSLYAVNAKTQNSELCIELMESILQNNLAQDSAYLYQNAEPVLDPDYDANVARQKGFIQESENQLRRDDLTDDERDKLEYGLERQKAGLQEMLENEEKKYKVSPSALATYRSYGDYLYVTKPGTFSNSEDAKNFYQLKARFVGGQLTAEQLTQELTRVAKMIEAEQGE
ncbi:MAG: hypothetical protein Q4B32_07985 [Clostridia bacterium]|nr:hypothetical protein [Clostridia bacterium]